MDKLTDSQRAYAKNYLANQAESVEEALDSEIHLQKTSSEIDKVFETPQNGK